MKKIIISLLYICIMLQMASAQDLTTLKKKPVSFNDFLDLVSKNNLEYAAEKFNVKISEAAIELAKVFPNPSLSVDLTDNREGTQHTGYGLYSEVATTFEMGGKRKARIDLAKSEKGLAQALLDDYFRNLRADAAVVYFEAVKQNQLYKVKEDSYETMKRLSEADSIRLSHGSIKEADAIQSKLETGILRNELLQAEAALRNSFCRLMLMAGISDNDTVFSPELNLNRMSTHFDLDQLILIAQDNRADLEAARHQKEVSEKSTILAKKERRMDMDFKIGLGNEFSDPDLEFRPKSITTGIAIPLKISNIYKGDLRMAQLYELQAEKIYAYVQLKIRAEITEAYQNYISTEKQVDNFESNLLDQSKNVLKGKIYSYQRGETSLLEVLNAQRTYNDIQATYIETLNMKHVALVELEKAAGIWDINL